MTGTNPGTRDLVAWWSLDEESGNRADSHGSNTLVDNNSVLFAVGKVNNAADFELDTSEFFSLADNPSISTGDIDFIYGCWVKAETLAGANTIGGKRTDATHREWQLAYEAGLDRFVFRLYNAAGAQIGVEAADVLGAPSAGTWYFIVIWHDSVGNTVNIQVNDGAVDSSATTGVPADTTANFYMGAQEGSSNFWDGLIDEAIFYKRTLTANEKSWLYNGGNGRAYSELSDFLPQVTIY